MYAPPTDNITPSQPLLMRFLTRSWEFSNSMSSLAYASCLVSGILPVAL